MADTLTLLGLMLNFAGALLLALQILGFVYPDYGTDAGTATMMQHRVGVAARH